jgi:hypothetical protein
MCASTKKGTQGIIQAQLLFSVYSTSKYDLHGNVPLKIIHEMHDIAQALSSIGFSK